ncbi:MAG: sulfate reduction electron transfer complex DsrMKJOP subunit DsrP [Terriglobales bacterium]
MLMLEKAIVGSRRYWTWLLFLLVVVLLGFVSYRVQLAHGLVITGLSRDVSWGLYIAQFTFLVGIAASAVTVVLPYYLHHNQQFAKLTILGEFLAISAITMCLLFVMVDMGQPTRVLNVLRYPSPRSLMFWDLISLGGYLVLNAVIALHTLSAERNRTASPSWLRPLIILSIPWAVSIHTVTAFLYSGLPGRPFWLTAILAPRFLASAFASGPALLLLLCLLLRRFTTFDVGREPIQKLGIIVTYAMTVNLFFFAVELFTAFYSRIPEHMHAFEYLFIGLDGRAQLAPWMWLSTLLAVVSLVVLLVPKMRARESVLAAACAGVFLSLWLEKGLCLVVCGFIPNAMGAVMPYQPTAPESLIVLGIWAFGSFMITIFYRITVAVREAE